MNTQNTKTQAITADTEVKRIPNGTIIRFANGERYRVEKPTLVTSGYILCKNETYLRELNQDDTYRESMGFTATLGWLIEQGAEANNELSN